MTILPDAFSTVTFSSAVSYASFPQKQHERVREQMEGVNASLKTSLDSLTTPRLTLSELDDIIKVGMHVACRFVFITDRNSGSLSQNNSGMQFKSVKLTWSYRSRIRRLKFSVFLIAWRHYPHMTV